MGRPWADWEARIGEAILTALSIQGDRSDVVEMLQNQTSEKLSTTQESGRTQVYYTSGPRRAGALKI